MVSTMKQYHSRMELFREKLGGKCVKCHRTKNLHIDHIDPSTKRFTIASHWSARLSLILKELKKCQLLCPKHHLAKSKAEGSLAKGWNKQPRQQHGTVWSYIKYKCRCKACKAAKSKAMKQQYRKKRSIAQR